MADPTFPKRPAEKGERTIPEEASGRLCSNDGPAKDAFVAARQARLIIGEQWLWAN